MGKILIADDNEQITSILSNYAQKEGFEPIVALDGEEAIAKFNKYSAEIQIILLDVMMPKKDGLEVLTEMRARNIVTPTLMLTAKTEIDDRVAGLDAGADDYLTKPFAMKEFLARVRAMTRRKTVYAARKLKFGDFSLDSENFELACENSMRLSVKEFELLQTLVLNSDHDTSDMAFASL